MNLKQLLCVAALCFCANVLSAQSTPFAQHYFSPDFEFLTSMTSSEAGWIYLAGWTGFAPPGDSNAMVIVQLDSLGQVGWSKTVSVDAIHGIPELVGTPDGGVLLAGISRNDAFQRQIWAMRLDSQGDTLWSRAYAPLAIQEVRSLTQVSDGGWLIAGQAISQDGLLMKVDSMGNLEWAREINEAGQPFTLGVKAIETQPGLYKVIFQNLNSFISSSIGTFDANGNLLFSVYFPAVQPFSETPRLEDLARTPERGHIVVGSNRFAGTLIKLDSLDQIEWQFKYTGGGFDYSFVKVLPDSTYLVLAADNANGVDILHFSSTGQVLTSNLLERENGGDLNKGAIGSDGQLYLLNQVPNCPSDSLQNCSFLTRTNLEGDGLCLKQPLSLTTIPGALFDSLELAALPIDGIQTLGLPVTFGTITVQSEAGCTTTSIGEANTPDLSLTCYPNPSHGAVKVLVEAERSEQITVEVFDLLGNLVGQHRGRANESISILQGPVSQGLYLVQVRSEQGGMVRERVIRY